SAAARPGAAGAQAAHTVCVAQAGGTARAAQGMVDAAAQPAGPEHSRASATDPSAAQRREQTQLPDLRQVLGLLVRIDLGHAFARRRGFLLLRLALAELACLALALLPFPGAGELPGPGRLDLLRRRPWLIPGISLLLLVPGERI